MIGIIGALKGELELIKRQINQISSKEILGSTFYYGKIFGKEVVVSECSIGKVNAAVTATIMIQEYNPDIIINTGISGSLDSRVKVLDVVIANKVSIHDENEVFTRYYPFKTTFELNKEYVSAVKSIYLGIDGNLNGVHIGEVITGDDFINNSLKKEMLKNNFKNSLAVDMESGAIAKVSFRAQKDIIVIKTISDEANDQANIDYNNFINLAAKRSANLVLKIIDCI